MFDGCARCMWHTYNDCFFGEELSCKWFPSPDGACLEKILFDMLQLFRDSTWRQRPLRGQTTITTSTNLASQEVRSSTACRWMLDWSCEAEQSTWYLYSFGGRCFFGEKAWVVCVKMCVEFKIFIPSLGLQWLYWPAEGSLNCRIISSDVFVCSSTRSKATCLDLHIFSSSTVECKSQSQVIWIPNPATSVYDLIGATSIRLIHPTRYIGICMLTKYFLGARSSPFIFGVFWFAVNLVTCSPRIVVQWKITLISFQN